MPCLHKAVLGCTQGPITARASPGLNPKCVRAFPTATALGRAMGSFFSDLKGRAWWGMAGVT